MKKRILVAVGVFLLFAVMVFPQTALDIHLFLSREPGLTWKPLPGWQAVLQGGNPLKFYLFLLAVWALMLFWAIASSSYIKYKSGMIHVTPDIATPEPAGQGQFGTAKWLPKNRIRDFFGILRVEENGKLKELLDAGRQDYEEIKHAKYNS